VLALAPHCGFQRIRSSIPADAGPGVTWYRGYQRPRRSVHLYYPLFGQGSLKAGLPITSTS
jgi:hypothetical protein